MPLVSADDIYGGVDGALIILNVIMPGGSVPAALGQMAFSALNDLLSEWSQRAEMIPLISRERFTMTADKGGPDDPYTIGDGGDFDTERPSNQNSIVSANLILTATSPEVRVPLGIYTDQAYDANQLPSMSNTQPTGLYYNPTYDNELGSIFLWPVPNTDENDLELFLQKNVAQFPDQTTEVYVPDGWPRALKYVLADTLAGRLGRTLTASDQRIMIAAKGTIERANFKLQDLANDATFALTIRRTLYNIMTGNG